MGRGQGCCYTSYNVQGSPTAKDYSAQYVSSAQIEKCCCTLVSFLNTIFILLLLLLIAIPLFPFLGVWKCVCIRLRQRRQWQPIPVLLPGRSHGWKSLVGCSPRGHRESDTTEWLHFDFSLSCIGEGNGNALQCSCLENPRDSGAWWAAIYGIAQSRIRLKRLSSSSSIHLREKILFQSKHVSTFLMFFFFPWPAILLEKNNCFCFLQICLTYPHFDLHRSTIFLSRKVWLLTVCWIKYR